MSQHPGTALTEPQLRTLHAVAARILPSDDGPGAVETGAAEYVAAALGEDRLRGWLPLFARGLDRLDAAARAARGTGFADTGPEDQDEILRQLQEIPEPAARHFFRQLVRLCLEGFVGDPRHGGNRGGLGWRYVGYPPEGMGEDGCLRTPPVPPELTSE